MEGTKPFTKCIENSKQRRLNLLRTGELSDCEFFVGEFNETSQMFHGHKMILASASEVFERMFYGEFPDFVGPVRITDVTPSSFEKFLQYIYVYELEDQLQFNEIAELFYLADKYMLQDLTNVVVDVVKSKSRLWWQDQILKVYELACLYDNLPLMLLSYKKIHEDAFNLLHSPWFYKMNASNLKRLVILLSDHPHVKTITLFRRLEEYGRRNNLIKDIDSENFQKLVDAACNVNFNKLTQSELEAGPGNSYIFKHKIDSVVTNLRSVKFLVN